MAYEERRVVTSDPAVDPAVAPVTDGTVVERREAVVEPTVVESRPATRIVHSDDPIGNAYAASQLIQTIIWSIVVIVLLVVLLVALHAYAHLF
jgi:hypothetical protein